MLAEAAMEGAFLAWFLEGPRPTRSTTADYRLICKKNLNVRRFHLEPEARKTKNAKRGYAIAIAIMGRRQPGLLRLFATGELVGDKHCAITHLTPCLTHGDISRFAIDQVQHLPFWYHFGA
jgi:hypothetical protein